VRQNGMMSPRHVHAIVGAGLLCAAVAGCGTVAASAPAAGQAAASAPAASAASASAVGCATVNQATVVTIHRTMRLVEPARVGPYTMTQRKPTLVRAIFSDFCKLVAHPYRSNRPVNCPAAFGLDYSGTFYAGQRKLATFVYGASGCQTVQVTAAGKSTFTMVMGSTASAAPQLENDMAAVLGLPQSAVYGPGGQQINPGGPMKAATKLRQVARLVEVELAVLDP
jgi:hypothetical protein